MLVKLVCLAFFLATHAYAWEQFTAKKEVTLSFMDSLEQMKAVIPGFKLPETVEFKDPLTCDPKASYEIYRACGPSEVAPGSLGNPCTNACSYSANFKPEGEDLKTTIVLTGDVNKELGVSASAQLKLKMKLGSGSMSIVAKGQPLAAMEYGDLGSVEFDLTLSVKTQPCNLLNMDFTLGGTITIGLGDTKQMECGVNGPVSLATFLAQAATTGSLKFPNIQYCLYDAVKALPGGATGGFLHLLKPDPTTGKTILTIPKQMFTIAAGDELVEHLKFSTVSVLKLSPLPPVLAVAQALEATGTDVVWSIPKASLVTQFTGVQFQIQAETTILNQDTLKMAMNPVLQLVGMELPLLDWKMNTLGMGLYFLNLVEPDKTLPAFICPSGDEGCKASDWETSGTLPEVGSFVMGHPSKACSTKTADFEISMLGITADDVKQLPAAFAKWQNEQLAKAGSKFTVPDCTKTSMGGDLGGGGADAKPIAVCLMQDLKLVDGKISATMHPGAGYNAGGFMQMLSAAIDDGTFALDVSGTGAPLKADPKAARKLPSCSTADLADAKAAGAEFACGGGKAVETPAVETPVPGAGATPGASTPDGTWAGRTTDGTWAGQGGGLSAGSITALAFFVSMVGAAIVYVGLQLRIEEGLRDHSQSAVADPREVFKDDGARLPNQEVANPTKEAVAL
jgi:hypothetical protein